MTVFYNIYHYKTNIEIDNVNVSRPKYDTGIKILHGNVANV